MGFFFLNNSFNKIIFFFTNYISECLMGRNAFRRWDPWASSSAATDSSAFSDQFTAASISESSAMSTMRKTGPTELEFDRQSSSSWTYEHCALLRAYEGQWRVCFGATASDKGMARWNNKQNNCNFCFCFCAHSQVSTYLVSGGWVRVCVQTDLGVPLSETAPSQQLSRHLEEREQAAV